MIDRTLEHQYNARAAVPGHAEIFDRWREESRLFRRHSECLLDLAYGEHPRERLDLFLSGGGRLHVFLHGGYWQAMDKSYFSFLARELTASGMDVAIVNYPLCPESTVPGILDSVRSACSYLWRSAFRVQRGWSAIQLSGHSAGGQLVSMLLSTNWPKWDPLVSDVLVSSGVSISGIYDLEPLRYTSINEKLHLDEPTARSQSPIHQRPATSAPMLLITGGEERPAFQEQMKRFHQYRHDLGLPTKSITLADRNHFTVIDELGREGFLLVQVLAIDSDCDS